MNHIKRMKIFNKKKKKLINWLLSINNKYLKNLFKKMMS
jgi:hypothetical protein